MVFDALWLNGENLATLPLGERRRKIETVIQWKARRRLASASASPRLAHIKGIPNH